MPLTSISPKNDDGDAVSIDVSVTEGSITIDGTVSVGNFPATQPISGTVTANAGTGTFVIGDGGNTIAVDDNGSSLTVDGPLTNAELRDSPVSVSGTVSLTSTVSTYGASISGLVPAITPTDIFTITGSDTKTIKISKIIISISATDTSIRSVFLIKRSTNNSGGTSSTRTNVPFDSSESAATATVRSYTANPSSLGTSLGVLLSRKFFISATLPLGSAGDASDHTIYESGTGKPITLRSSSENLCVNLNSVTLVGGNADISIEWTEE